MDLKIVMRTGPLAGQNAHGVGEKINQTHLHHFIVWYIRQQLFFHSTLPLLTIHHAP